MSMDSRLAASMNPQVLTSTASADSAFSTRSQPPTDSRPANSSESTSFRAHPSVTIATFLAGGIPTAYGRSD